ncbi:unnamed protein product [Cylicocyclus nassatus]|uniref:Uncharacterized protein n=1 Tax=Cylicocyclus nassatus TaxID=53992 RepID=A0AA36DKT1_CYLNA|nr:unnamed protein product [Cylicocyclus nassatus]
MNKHVDSENRRLVWRLRGPDKYSEIRRILAHIVLYCKPTNATELCHKFKGESLKSIKRITANGTSMMDCGLEGIFNDLTNKEDASPEISEEEDDAIDSPINLSKNNS